MRQPASVRLARTETRLFLREPVALFFSIAFPLVLLLFLGPVIAEEELESGLRGIDVFIPSMMALTAANIGVLGLAIHIAENRSRGVLRRLRLSPIRAADYFLAQMLTQAVVLVLAMILVTIVTFSVYGPTEDPQILPFLGATVITVYVTFSVGVLLGGLRLPVRSVQVIGATVFFLMFFGSGVAIPRQAFPDWLYTVSEFNPLAQLNDFLLHAYGGMVWEGWWEIAAVVGFGAVLNLISWRSFDWEGRT